MLGARGPIFALMGAGTLNTLGNSSTASSPNMPRTMRDSQVGSRECITELSPWSTKMKRDEPGHLGQAVFIVKPSDLRGARDLSSDAFYCTITSGVTITACCVTRVLRDLNPVRNDH